MKFIAMPRQLVCNLCNKLNLKTLVYTLLHPPLNDMCATFNLQMDLRFRHNTSLIFRKR